MPNGNGPRRRNRGPDEQTGRGATSLPTIPPSDEQLHHHGRQHARHHNTPGLFLIATDCPCGDTIVYACLLCLDTIYVAAPARWCPHTAEAVSGRG